MEITPVDILNKRFPRRMRGYEPSEVDEFLRATAASFEGALSEVQRLREHVESLEQELQRYRDMESTLNNALVLAQKTTDEMRANAEKEAELVVREAQAGISASKSELENLQKLRERFEVEFRTLLRTYLELLEGGDSAGRAKQSSGK